MRKILQKSFLIFLTLAVSGCSTTHNTKLEQNSQLQNDKQLKQQFDLGMACSQDAVKSYVSGGVITSFALMPEEIFALKSNKQLEPHEVEEVREWLRNHALFMSFSFNPDDNTVTTSPIAPQNLHLVGGDNHSYDVLTENQIDSKMKIMLDKLKSSVSSVFTRSSVEFFTFPYQIKATQPSKVKLFVNQKELEWTFPFNCVKDK
ncbi:MAG: hypothetical protein WCI06_02910 [Methylococcaceae bacterium]